MTAFPDDLLVPAGTFMSVPAATAITPGQGVILGIPFDCGTHPTRIGARQGPRAIREQSGLVRPVLPELGDRDILAAMDVVDLGDVAVVSGQTGPALAAIESALDMAVAQGGYPVTFGGDGLVTLPQLRALHRHYPDLAVLHIDAHTDAYEGEGYNTSTTFTRAAEEGIIDVARSFHIGARGTLMAPGAYDHTRALGYNLISGAELRRRGVDDVVDEVRARTEGRPLYLCFDMDFFDPSAAPGVATPTWGGPDAATGLDFLNALAGLPIVAVDINTVSPPHDVGGMTACLAGHVAVTALNLMYLGRNAHRQEA
ncbi:MAG: arginase family protein [Rhodobacteraceae bacterium]|nr:arginase family protein [Paracoccaceae bacterium]